MQAFRPNQLLRQQRPNRPQYRHNGAHNNKTPIQRRLGLSQFFSKEFKMERNRKDDANTKTGHTPEQRHYAIKIGEDDGNEGKSDNGSDAKEKDVDTARQARHTVHAGREGEATAVESEKDFEGGVYGSSVQRTLGQRNDRNTNCHKHTERLRVPLCQKDVGSNLIHDAVAEHKKASAHHAHVDQISEAVGDVDGPAVFIGMTHVAINVWKDGMTTPGGHEEAEGEGNGKPVLWKEVLLGRGKERAWGVGFDEAVDPDDYYN